MDKLYIIGNGFDIAHGLPTSFNPDFENIAKNLESIPFFGIYINLKIMIFGLTSRIC